MLFSRPLVVLFHQILAPAWANVIMNAAKPELAAPKTVSTKSGAIKSVAQKRSGQVAFVTGSYVDDAEKVCKGQLISKGFLVSSILPKNERKMSGLPQ